jgi:hypothetical protein
LALPISAPRGDDKYRAAVVQRIAGRRAAWRWLAAADVDDVDGVDD